MKKKVLFICSSYRSGGAEKAFISLLKIIPKNEFDISAMAIEEDGIFMAQLPDYVNTIHAPQMLSITYASIRSTYFWKNFKLTAFLKKIWIILLKVLVNSKESLSGDQFFWQKLKNTIAEDTEKYDAVVAFTGGLCNYYAIDKINASIKLLWVHNDYNKIKCQPLYDYNYFKKATYVATISQGCVQSLVNKFPDIKEKFILVENVSSISEIRSKSDELINDYIKDIYDFTITSIGRLEAQKGYDMAVEAAHIMKSRGFNFCWYIIGEGKLRHMLEAKIKKYNLQNNFKLLGLRSNPYPYIKAATIFVMTSRYEGKSIALDEAKILCKPIISTKYPSVFDNLKDGINGVLVEQDPQIIANAIINLYQNKGLRKSLEDNLKLSLSSNEEYVKKQMLNLLKQ